MKRLATIGTCLLIIALAMTGCSGEDSSEPPSTPSSVADTQSATNRESAGDTQPTDVLGTLIYAEGQVSIISGDVESVADIGDQVAPGDQILTGSDGRADLDLGELGKILIDPNTLASMEAVSGVFSLELSRGGVIAKAATLAGTRRFEIRSPSVVAGVRGTEFRVVHDEQTGATLVAVREGSVAVIPREVLETTLAEEAGLSDERAIEVVEILYDAAVQVPAGNQVTLQRSLVAELVEALKSLTQVIAEVGSADDESIADELEKLDQLVTPVLRDSQQLEPLSGEQLRAIERLDETVSPDAPSPADSPQATAARQADDPVRDNATATQPATAATSGGSTSTDATSPDATIMDTTDDTLQTVSPSVSSPTGTRTVQRTQPDPVEVEDTPVARTDAEASGEESGAASKQRPEPTPLQQALSYPIDHRVAAMYYAWYGSAQFDRAWLGWDEPGTRPPGSWGSRYEPYLGLYSSRDPGVLETHMQWARRAGIGTLIMPWFGPDSSYEDIMMVLNTAHDYGLRVAFRAEGDVVTNPVLLPGWVRYLGREFASHPGYLKMEARSPWQPGIHERPVLFVFAVDSRFAQWSSAMDSVRGQNDYPFVLASGFDLRAVTDGRLDGIALGPVADPNRDYYRMEQMLPANAIWVPSITPGFASFGMRREQAPRQNGSIMEQQLNWATLPGADPAMMVVTSFNRWADGTQIEPVVADPGDGRLDYGPLGPFGYLEKTRELADRFAARPTGGRARIRVTIDSSSDWAQMYMTRVPWNRYTVISRSQGVTEIGFNLEEGWCVVEQSSDDVRRGRQVTAVIEITVPAGEPFQLGFNKGHNGFIDVLVTQMADDLVSGSGATKRIRDTDSGGTELASFNWSGRPNSEADYRWETITPADR